MNMKKLQRQVNSCGLGFPNLLYYYYAFSLRHLAHLALPPERVPPWYNMEQSVCAPLPLIHCLSTNLSKEMNAHPVISHLQRAWKRVSGLMKFDPYLNSASTIWRNPKFNINKKTFIWKEWVEKGILRLEHLYGTDTLKSFDDLKQQYHLPQTQFWRYLQWKKIVWVEASFPKASR